MKPENAARARYDKTHTARVYIKLNLRTDFDILCKLAEVKNRQGYIKALIRKDILENPPILKAKDT